MRKSIANDTCRKKNGARRIIRRLSGSWLQGELGVFTEHIYASVSNMSFRLAGGYRHFRVGVDLSYDSDPVFHAAFGLAGFATTATGGLSGAYTFGFSYPLHRSLMVTGLVDRGQIGGSLRFFPVTGTEIEMGVIGDRWYLMGHIWI